MSIFLTSSTSSLLACGKMISIRLPPTLRIGISLTPSGSARFFRRRDQVFHVDSCGWCCR